MRLAFVIAFAAGGTGTTRSRQCAMQLSFFSQKTTVTRDLLERFLNIKYTKFETVVSLKFLISVGCFFSKKQAKGKGEW